MRTKQKSYSDMARESVRRDFNQNNYRQRANTDKNNQRRIIYISENSGYFKFKSYIIGKLVRVLRQTDFGACVCEFVYDDDRKNLNRVADWSDNKREYIFDGVKFKE